MSGKLGTATSFNLVRVPTQSWYCSFDAVTRLYLCFIIRWLLHIHIKIPAKDDEATCDIFSWDRPVTKICRICPNVDRKSVNSLWLSFYIIQTKSFLIFTRLLNSCKGQYTEFCTRRQKRTLFGHRRRIISIA